MKRILFLFIFLLYHLNIIAQQYGNEWVNYSQTYYKIPVISEGIHRINKSTLETTDFPLYNIPLSNIQLFSKGEEQYITIKTNQYGMLEYIEFYGKPNDGWLDKAMYKHPQNQANPYSSLINDTAYYFLTWNLTNVNGKRYSLETDISFSAYTVSNYCLKNVYTGYRTYYYGAEDNAFFTEAEGWFDTYFSLGGSKTKSILTPNAYNSGPLTSIEFVVAGASNAYSNSPSGDNHRLQVDIQSVVLFDTTYKGYVNIKKDLLISSNSLGSSLDITFRSVNSQGAITDNNAIAYINLKYPHTFNFENSSSFKFYLSDASSSKSYLNINNFNGGSTIPVLYDLTNHKKITVVQSGTNFQALIPNSGGAKECYISSETAINNVIQIKKVTFTDYSNSGKNSDYIIITHPKLWSSATNYKNYRNTTGYKTLLVDIDDLYNQFAYGINKHPIAIKNFMNYLINTYDSIPKYLFLIGKGVIVSTCPIVTGCPDINNYSYSVNAYHTSLIPSIGNPPSDILLTAGLIDTLFEPAVPIGRLAANTNEQVEIYLDKVKDYEDNVPERWMKNIIHFSGGQTVGEQTQFFDYLNKFKQIIEDTLFGGHVYTVRKNSSVPIQISEADSIKNTINTGCSMLTFFGHGSTSGFDQSTDYPSNYNNKGKYPFILANSCNVGNIFIFNSYTINEDWIFTKQKGAIGFLASNDLGHSTFLNGYSKELYKNIAYKNYGKGIGKCIQNTINIYQHTGLNNDILTNTCASFTLHGDPAIVINSHPLPDLVVSNSSISFTPNNITNAIDSFQINIIVTNIGRATASNYILEVNRTFPDGTNEIFSKSVNGAYFEDTIRLKLPVNFIKGSGLNRFCITVDAMQQITEISELNNSACVDLIIYSGDLVPVYPYNFSIYPNATVTLKASTVNPLLPVQANIFQIDTNDTYNSPFKKEYNISTSGGVVTWTPPFTLTDSTVYYWRVSKAPPSGSTQYNWKESSFIYKPTKTGWSQAHFFQFKDDKYNFINYNRPARKYDFITTPKQLNCHTGGGNFYTMGFTIDGTGGFGCIGVFNAIHVVVIDTATLLPWLSDRENYGQINHNITQNHANKYFSFYTDRVFGGVGNMQNLKVMLRDSVPNGFYILVYTILNVNFDTLDTWDPTFYTTFENLGANSIRFVGNYNPYIFFCKKGYTATAQETLGTYNGEEIDLSAYLSTNFKYGNISTNLIGPSTKWKSLHWFQKPSEINSTDSSSLKVIGVLPNGNENVLFTLPTDSLDIYNLNQRINPVTYPYLKLDIYSTDTLTKTPAQIKKWQLEYNEVPETALNPSKGYFFQKDTLNEGDTLKFAIATENISRLDMDSLLISYFIKDKNNNYHSIIRKRLGMHPAGSILIDTIKFSTLGLSGLNSLWYEVNPIDTVTQTYDQLEQYHFNNYAQKYFYVESDITNPLLDVTFDGVHIINGDIISSKPNILIKLKDENKFLALNDTSLFNLYIKAPNDANEKRIYFSSTFGNDVLQWTSAQMPDNSCKILYTPIFTEDGKYQLRIQAKDASNNESGKNDYIITFEVINKSSITEIFNYPNPFSTSTRFVFTLTGYEIPTDFRIQILTITGKLVREIGLSELGNIHIGNNITEFAWDGTDMFGDRLANGVYFYKVITSINGKSIDKRDTGSSKYFKKDIGKMYLMR